MGRAMEVFDDVSEGESFGVFVFACVPYGRHFSNGKAQRMLAGIRETQRDHRNRRSGHPNNLIL